MKNCTASKVGSNPELVSCLNPYPPSGRFFIPERFRKASVDSIPDKCFEVVHSLIYLLVIDEVMKVFNCYIMQKMYQNTFGTFYL